MKNKSIDIQLLSSLSKLKFDDEQANIIYTELCEFADFADILQSTEEQTTPGASLSLDGVGVRRDGEGTPDTMSADGCICVPLTVEAQS